MSDEGKWCYSTDGERYHGGFLSRDEALAEGREYLVNNEDDVGKFEYVVFVGRIRAFSPEFSGALLIEQAQCDAYDEVNELSEDWLNTTKEQDKELGKRITAVFMEWMKENGHEPNFWCVDHVEEIELGIDDVPGIREAMEDGGER